MSDGKTIYGSGDITSGSTLLATGTVEQAIAKIEASGKIPAGEIKTIKGFVEEKFNELREYKSELMDFPVPDNISEWWPVVVEILQQII